MTIRARAVSDEERESLGQMARSRTLGAGLVRRAQIVTHALEGLTAPEIGARILRDIKQIEDIIPGVMHHHERFDGRGYPSGLAGQNIPLMGRIICLADCFDAMTSSRTYRSALPFDTD